MRVRTGRSEIDYGPTPGRTQHASIAGSLVVPPRIKPVYDSNSAERKRQFRARIKADAEKYAAACERERIRNQERTRRAAA